MKIQLKNKNDTLPNCWKQCGVGKDSWDKLQKDEEIDVKSIPESIKHLVEVITSSNINKKESK